MEVYPMTENIKASFLDFVVPRQAKRCAGKTVCRANAMECNVSREMLKLAPGGYTQNITVCMYNAVVLGIDVTNNHAQKRLNYSTDKNTDKKTRDKIELLQCRYYMQTN